MKKALLAAAIATFSLSAVAKDDLQYSKAIDQSLKSGKIAYFIEGKKGAGEKNNAVCEDGLFFNDHYLAVFDGATNNRMAAAETALSINNPGTFFSGNSR